ncbi:MAG TPA: serine hydrolase domain-containing protein, partial [Chitinivibrionales bacterium]
MIKQVITRRLEQAISDNVFPGCVAGVVGANKETLVMPVGHFTYESSAPAMTENSVFDVASITKAIPTSSIALMLIDSGKLHLSDKVIGFIPELRMKHAQDVTVFHVLTQTLNFGFRLSDFKDQSPEGIIDVICSTELAAPPGTSFYYTNATSILLGMMIERLTGQCLATLADEHFFKPLEMSRTTFFPEMFKPEEIVPTEHDPWRGRLIRGEVHDESAFTLRQKMVAGSAGLFSTVGDILKFLSMMLSGGEMSGRRFFSSKTMEAIQTNQVALPGVCTGLGWELCQKRYMGSLCTPRTFGKTGFTGCVCMADIGKGAAFALLSNYTYPARKPDMVAINRVRSDC